MNLLTIHHATKRYGSHLVLQDASLELIAGEAHALLGENGAGKSTLIKLLAGVVSADSLKLSLRGSPVAIHNASDAFRQGLRFIHQELMVVPQLSVAENLFLQQAYPKRLGFVDWRRLNMQARAMLAELGIQHIAPEQKMAWLSTGDKMLVKIAASLLGEGNTTASVYILDEPTAALSATETETLFRLINTLKARGCAILYVSHRLEEIFKICERVTVMRDGKTIVTKSTAETSSAELIQLMTGRELNQTYPARVKPRSNKGLLSVKKLTTVFLKDIQFDLHEGEILGLAGLSGSGQSELLQALIGADAVQHSDMALAGTAFKPVSPASAWAQGLALVPAERRTQGLVLRHHVGHNIALPHLKQLSFAGVLQNQLAQQRLAKHMGQKVTLKARGIFQRVHELSGGNQQKVVFARAMAKSPRVLLLDEPTRGVDVGAKADIYNLIRQVSHDSTGVLLASSDLGELLGLCDRILILKQGQQVALVENSGLSQADLLALCYEGIKA